MLESGEQRIVVSTVGLYFYRDKLTTIGADNRYYETMAFEAKEDGPYWDADVTKQLSFESQWEICAKTPTALPPDVDNQADQMHEAVVDELARKMADT